jgi:S-adenosylmethionine decarboxylase
MDSGTLLPPHSQTSGADHLVRRGTRAFAGVHLLIDVRNGLGFDDEARVRQAILDCVSACGATLLHLHTHRFTPQGITGVAVLAESHIAAHTWPEHGYAAFDIFMCGSGRPEEAIAVLARAFETEDIGVREVLRGEVSV